MLLWEYFYYSTVCLTNTNLLILSISSIIFQKIAPFIQTFNLINKTLFLLFSCLQPLFSCSYMPLSFSILLRLPFFLSYCSVLPEDYLYASLYKQRHKQNFLNPVCFYIYACIHTLLSQIKIAEQRLHLLLQRHHSHQPLVGKPEYPQKG